MNRAPHIFFSISLFLSFLVFSTGCRSTVDDSVFLIENVTLIDGTGREAIPNAYVLVDGERFAAVSPVALAAPEGTKRIDGTGKYLIPGLIDSHIHLPGGRTGPGNREMIMDPETGLNNRDGDLI